MDSALSPSYLVGCETCGGMDSGLDGIGARSWWPEFWSAKPSREEEEEELAMLQNLGDADIGAGGHWQTPVPPIWAGGGALPDAKRVLRNFAIFLQNKKSLDLSEKLSSVPSNFVH